ncbi:hypothetical protein OV208_27525 [Corallococcus sp. bb12-1]|uniref:hypothetical protein n=1 Tax=Corallococcus sp. bb12-1 TaxID=2996784 RepID=UPI00226E7BAA|nr:hypothetical protein [Corallococcus sp. bb12-1]MCY1045095.1 hypothetical protein [Corallococcus sp. bb12-1]
MKPSPFFRTSGRVLAALAFSFVAACSDNTNPDDGNPDAGTGTPDSGTPTTPLYAFVAQVSADSASTSYVILTDKVDHTEPLSLANATEINGRALGSGIEKAGALFVSSSGSAVVTRYNVTADNKLEKAGEVSFAGKGLTTIGEYQNQFQFASDTKAYYFDGRTAQVVVWNPKDMSVTNTIPLPGMTIDGTVLSFASNPIRVGTKVLMPLAWRPAAGIGITKKAGIVVLDTATDTAQIATDDRCGYVRDGVVGSDGQVYLATEAYGAAVKRTAQANPDVPEPCLLKFDPQTATFDAAFYKSLGALTNGSATGSLLQGPTGTGYLRVLDETTYTVVEGTHPRVIASAVAWKWWKLDLKADMTAAALVDTLPASTGSSFLFHAGDRTLFTEFTNSSSTTNFRELTDQSGKLVATHSGLSFSFLQLR